MQRIIDFRSDTLTAPDDPMRAAMSVAKVGDDVYGEDPTVKELEREVAALTGKEDALFVPSGTMSNLIALTVHCSGLFSEVIVGHDSHIFRYEVGGSVLARAHTYQLETSPDGTIPLDRIRRAIRDEDVHCTTTRLVCLENTHNERGGRILPLEYLSSLRRLADEKNVKLHCDGARIWNAAVGSKRTVKELAAPFDTISVCCSKGLAAPVGSLLCGPTSFIAQARRARKMYGGGMRQAGIIAAGALYAVRHMYSRLEEDHRWCRELSDGVRAAGLAVIEPETNILIWKVAAEQRGAFLQRCREQGLLLSAMGTPENVRAIPHFGNNDEDIREAIAIVKRVVAELGLAK